MPAIACVSLSPPTPLVNRFFNIIVYATVHGLVLTPVLLSVVPLTPPVVLLADEPEKDAKAVESAQSSESGL